VGLAYRVVGDQEVPSASSVVAGLTVAAAALSLAAAPAAAQPGPITFTTDIAPLIYRHCATCHRPGGSSSTDLITYAAARAHARQIVDMTASGRMPPWQPEPDWGTFEGDRRLTSGEIRTFQRWLDGGLVEGDPRALPSPPVFPEGWELGKPDLVLTMPEYTLRADGPDMFRNFVIAVPGDRLRYVRAWEFRPGNARAVHHATMQVDTTGTSRRYDESDPAPGYEGLIAPAARAPDGFFLDWAPGHRPATAVAGTAWPLPAGSDLVMMLHLRPTGRTEKVQASLALYFSDRPPAHTPVMLRLTRQDLDIAPGTNGYSVDDRYVLPVDVDMYTVQPHAHYLAREMTAAATRPDGATIPLIRIRDWDFNWQDVYHYAQPIRLAAGTTLTMSIAYDNTTANPRNPNNPPRRVTYGQQTSDEMAEMWFQVIPVDPSQRERLVNSLYRKVLPQEIRGRTAMSRADPRNVALHDDLALMLADAGDQPAAEREFRVSLALQPGSAAARFNVGLAVLARGDRQQARMLFDSALEADPVHGPSHFQLGLMLQAEGRLAEAAIHLDAAADARPTDPEVLLSAGVLDALRGNDDRAIVRLGRALDLRPDWPNAEVALASVLSTSASAAAADRRRAVILAEHAVVMTARRNGAYLDILAGSYAAVGDRERAMAAERDAVAAAESEGDDRAAEHFRVRLAQLERDK
jgi:tetratricopeptide (TPR) repeat protein